MVALFVLFFAFTSVSGCSLSSSSSIPSISDGSLKSQWISHKSYVARPTTQNLHGSLIAGQNLMSFEELRSAPFSQAYLPGCTLSVNDVALDLANHHHHHHDDNDNDNDNDHSEDDDDTDNQPGEHRWSAYSIERRKTITIDGQPVTFTSDLRMGYSYNSVLLSLDVNSSFASSSSSPLAFSLSLSSLTPFLRSFAVNDKCTNWHFPRTNQDDCWNWFPPVPSVSSLSSDFNVSVSSLSSVLSVDLLSQSASSVQVQPQPDTLVVEQQTENAYPLSRGRWFVSLNSSSPVWSLRYVLVFGSDAADVQSSSLSLMQSFESHMQQVMSENDYLFKALFTPGCSGLFSGWLPTLTTDAAWLSSTYYMSALSLLVNLRTSLARDLGFSRAYIVGQAGNATTNAFIWDMSFVSTVIMLLDPTEAIKETEMMLKADITQYWGVDLLSGHGVGDWYAANDMSIFTLLYTYVSIQNDTSLLSSLTLSGSPLSYWLNMTSTHWLNLTLPPEYQEKEAEGEENNLLRSTPALVKPDDYLADFGGPHFLLECVPSYTNKVAAFNAANSWMMRKYADVLTLLDDINGTHVNNATAALYAQYASSIADAVMKLLYVAPDHDDDNDVDGGYFRALYPNATSADVRTIVDFVYVSLFLDEDGGGVLTPSVRQAMRDFFFRELNVKDAHWMRALSLKDEAAPFSNRSDHGPSGAYDGWPSFSIKSLFHLGFVSDGVDFLRGLAPVTALGPFGQAHELINGATTSSQSGRLVLDVVDELGVYKPWVYTLYNELVGGAFADTIITTIFGFSPDIIAASSSSSFAPPLLLPKIPRGVNATLTGVRYGTSHFTIVSDDNGLTVYEDGNPPQ